MPENLTPQELTDLLVKVIMRMKKEGTWNAIHNE